MRWDVPPLHVHVCQWLEYVWLAGGDTWLLMLPRGHAKSTILEVFNAWLYYCYPTLRILHQSEGNGTALKTSRGTQNVLRHHVLTVGMLPDDSAVEQWWIAEAKEVDARNASMYAKGILSNVTSSRADFVQNDDVEVPKNIGKPELREKLRFRLSEQIHIAVPGAPHLYIGTPHTHDSLYEDIKKLGADALVVKMFMQEKRIDKADKKQYALAFVPDYIFSGIGKESRLLVPGVDYQMNGTTLTLTAPGGDLLDCYADAAWPERFTGEEMEKRRRKCRTLNEWDSQYQLHSKPVTEVRLDPERIVPYDVKPVVRFANDDSSMFLGGVQIVGASARWDPASGNLNRDVSAFAVVLQDAMGRRYLHHVAALTGDIAEFGPDGEKIIGGQVFQICKIIDEFGLTRVVVESNGVGVFAPAILRACIKQRRMRCGVTEKPSVTNKNRRILETFQPLLLTRSQLWAHVDVLNGPFWDQLRDWNPTTQNQEDDYIDAAAGAIAETPERIGKIGGNAPPKERDSVFPNAGVFDYSN